ncbi:MAG: hypothetical protein FJ037_09535 [Chloroflexi bacterium]|nr:hypothetical protein [Chloroflexota bacterium]
MGPTPSSLTPFPEGRGQGDGPPLAQRGQWGAARRPLRLPLIAVIALAATLTLACDRGEPPPTNPLDESRVTAKAAPVPAGPAVFPPAGASTSTPAPGGSAAATATTAPLDPAAEAARERAAGRAIDAISGWLGVAKTEFSIVLVDVVAWPDACLGVPRPDVMCAQVVTPGERVTVRHRSGMSYQVHLGPRDAAAWSPPFESARTIASVDLASGFVVLQPIAGNDELGTRHRMVPGSIAAGVNDLKPGDRVRIAVAPWPAQAAGFGAIVWLVRAP